MQTLGHAGPAEAAGVSVVALSKRFGDTEVLRDVSLDIREGEFLTLVGPSGCGKSTLLRLIAGLDRQTSGSIHIGGVCVDDIAPKRRDVSMVFQSYALYPHLTAFDNMALPLVMRRMNSWQRLPLVGRLMPGAAERRRDIAASVNEVAESLAVGHLLQRKPAQLSGGQRQRIALGRAMVRHARVFLMDEPLSNLDAKLRVQMRAEIAELHRRLGVTFIYVTHDQAEAMTMSDRVAVMMHGELIQVAPPRAVYAEPASVAVAEFIGSPKINLLPGTVRADGAVAVPGGVLPLATTLPAGTAVRLGLRPDAFELAPHGLPGRVAHVEYLGSDLFVHVRIDGMPEPVTIRLDPERAAGPHIAADIHLRPLLDRALLFGPDGRRVRLEAECREVRHG